MTVQPRNHRLHHNRMSLVDHGQRVRPTCPICWRAGAHCTAQPQTTQTQRKCGTVGCGPITLIRWNPQQSAEAVPETIVMHLGIPQDLVGRQHAQQIISPRTGAMEQQKPRRLEVGNTRDPLQEDVLFFQNLLQLSSHIIRVA